MSQKTRLNFYDSSESQDIIDQLTHMQTDDKYATGSSYSANTEKYPNHQMPFIDKHMEYLRTHPSIHIDQYLANLRLITKVR